MNSSDLVGRAVELEGLEGELVDGRARPRPHLAYAGVTDLATPTLAQGESVDDLLATADDFDPDAAGRRDYGFVRLNQLAVEHLVG